MIDHKLSILTVIAMMQPRRALFIGILAAIFTLYVEKIVCYFLKSFCPTNTVPDARRIPPLLLLDEITSIGSPSLLFSQQDFESVARTQYSQFLFNSHCLQQDMSFSSSLDPSYVVTSTSLDPLPASS